MLLLCFDNIKEAWKKKREDLCDYEKCNKYTLFSDYGLLSFYHIVIAERKR